jgi:hypothetical protein
MKKIDTNRIQKACTEERNSLSGIFIFTEKSLKVVKNCTNRLEVIKKSENVGSKVTKKIV